MMTRENTRQEERMQVLQAISVVSQRLARNLSLLSADDLTKGGIPRGKAVQPRPPVVRSQRVYRRCP